MPAFSAEVVFPANRVKEPVVLELKITQEEYRHDLAVYETIGTASRPQYRTGAPVIISWRKERDSASFVGSVHHTESTDQGIRVWCKGASSRFDNGLQATYERRTVSNVVAQLARDLNFDVDITPHGQVFDSLTATGGRTWEFMVKYAKEIGYSLYAKNTRLLLHPRIQTVERMMGQAPVLWRGDALDRGTLHEFNPIEGAAQPGEFRHDNVLQGIDRYTGQHFRVAGGQARGRLGREQYGATGRVFHNLDVSTPEEARWKSYAMAEMARFNVRATALAEGEPRVHQTWPVLLGGDVDKTFIGGWFVHRVVHRMTQSEYVMELELGRDARGMSGDVPDPRAKRVVATRDTPEGRPKSAYPPDVLVNGQWRAQWSSATRSM